MDINIKIKYFPNQNNKTYYILNNQFNFIIHLPKIMSNGLKSLIKLTTFNKTTDHVLYQLELQHENEWHSISLRFSELRKLFKNIHNENDNIQIEFPSSYYIASALKSILPETYGQSFNQLRFQQLKTYFNNLSQNINLKNLPQFNSLILRAKINERQILNAPLRKPRSLDRQLALQDNLKNNTNYITV